MCLCMVKCGNNQSKPHQTLFLLQLIAPKLKHRARRLFLFVFFSSFCDLINGAAQKAKCDISLDYLINVQIDLFHSDDATLHTICESVCIFKWHSFNSNLLKAQLKWRVRWCRCTNKICVLCVCILNPIYNFHIKSCLQSVLLLVFYFWRIEPTSNMINLYNLLSNEPWFRADRVAATGSYWFATPVFTYCRRGCTHFIIQYLLFGF